ncbi:thioredoxin [Corynebacterium dentalis]|uniref:thioredoxin n=1 Tax=Corynebacterium dentalis TaxID=2014528 RepID=UPI00289C8D09|nr:thioredoxin [Corynebacterium dentalis]
MATVEITGENFQDTISKDGVVLLDFWAEWCGPCKRFGPIFEEVSEQFPDHTFGKVDTEANQELSAALQIQSIPTLMVFRDGVLLAREAGLLPAAALQELIGKAEELDMEEVRKQIEAAQAEQQQAGE